MDEYFLEIKTTCGSREEAQRIARAAVEMKLCACAHIAPINSFYRWNDSVVEDTEFEVVMKAPSHSLNPIRDLIKAEHSYELPAFYAVPVASSSAEYLQWIVVNSRGAQ